MSVGRSQNTNASLVVTVFSTLASAVAPASGSVSSRLRMDDPVSAARRAEAAASPTSPARKIQRVDVALRDHRQLEVCKDIEHGLALQWIGIRRDDATGRVRQSVEY